MPERKRRIGLSHTPKDPSLAFDALELGLSPQQFNALRAEGSDRGGGKEKGEAAEDRVGLILGKMTLEGRIPSFRKAGEEEDLDGADYFIQQEEGEEIPIQVKASSGGAEKFRQKGRRWRRSGREVPKIEVVVAGRAATNTQIRRRIIEIIDKEEMRFQRK